MINTPQTNMITPDTTRQTDLRQSQTAPHGTRMRPRERTALPAAAAAAGRVGWGSAPAAVALLLLVNRRGRRRRRSWRHRHRHRHRQSHRPEAVGISIGKNVAIQKPLPGSEWLLCGRFRNGRGDRAVGRIFDSGLTCLP